MRMVDIISKTKNKIELNEDEIRFMIQGMIHHKIPDYQMSAWMMAVYFNSLTDYETSLLTKEMMKSGDIIDLSEIKGIKVDKHSTGGVGDKTTLVLAPMVSACGVNIAKMSGRGLGHTGGTLDKLESIPGFNIHLDPLQFVKQVNDIHIAIIGQSEKLVLADKMMYALRDVTSTVDCIALIASSIMSKKLASGNDAILLDVKYGDGAFMKTKEEARQLASLMIRIGKSLNKNVKVTLSNMNQPLGYAIGNILEVKEVIDTLLGHGPCDLVELCIQSGIEMLMMANIVNNKEDARRMLEESLNNKSAYYKFLEMVEYQGGCLDYIKNPDLFDQATYIIPLFSKETGYVHDLKAMNLGLVSMKLGGGRMTKDDDVDYSVGIILKKKIGDYVSYGDVLLYIHANSEVDNELIDCLYESYLIDDTYIDSPLIVEEIL